MCVCQRTAADSSGVAAADGRRARLEASGLESGFSEWPRSSAVSETLQLMSAASNANAMKIARANHSLRFAVGVTS